MAVYGSMLLRARPHNGSTSRYRFCCCLVWERKQNKVLASDSDKSSCHQTLGACSILWPNNRRGRECGSDDFWRLMVSKTPSQQGTCETIDAKMGSKLSLQLGERTFQNKNCSGRGFTAKNRWSFLARQASQIVSGDARMLDTVTMRKGFGNKRAKVCEYAQPAQSFDSILWVCFACIGHSIWENKPKAMNKYTQVNNGKEGHSATLSEH